MSTPHQPSDPSSDAQHGMSSRSSADGAPPQGGSPGPFRSAVERASSPVLTRLARLPVWLPFLILLVLLLGGGFLGGPVGWVLVGLALAFILWLFYLSWPQLSGVDRLMRIAVLAVFVAATLVLLFPR